MFLFIIFSGYWYIYRNGGTACGEFHMVNKEAVTGEILLEPAVVLHLSECARACVEYKYECRGFIYNIYISEPNQYNCFKFK